MRINTVLASVILGVSFVLGLSVLAATWRGNREAAQTLQVTGSATMDLVSDLGLLRFWLAGQGTTAQAAWRDLERQRPLALAFLAERGVTADDLQTFPAFTSSFDEFDQNGNRTGRILRYDVRQGFLIEHRDVQLVRQLSLDLGALVTEGVNVSTNAPEYLFTGLAGIKEEVQALAATDAMRRAKKVADAAGARLGTIRGARMGVLQVTPRHSTQVSDWGINDNSSIEKQITAVVHASFAIR